MPRSTSIPEHHTTPATAPRGQIVIMFALFLVGMMGMLGLATDLGFAFAQRRTMQNSADAGALAGARIVAKSYPSAKSALNDVQAVVGQNKMGSSAPQLVECVYVNDSDAIVGSCNAPAPASATGVRVKVREQHNTFFIQVVPGISNLVVTEAIATAHVQKAMTLPADGPFLVCGINTRLAGSGNMSIMIPSGGGWKLNPAAVGQTFEVHGPRITRCNAQSSRFKGVAEQNNNVGKSTPDWFEYTEGDAAGPVREDVRGIQGCKAGQTIDNCIAYLPVVVDTPPEADNNRKLWTVIFVPFYIVETGSNRHTGQLVSGYIITSRDHEAGWFSGYLGPIVVRLTR